MLLIGFSFHIVDWCIGQVEELDLPPKRGAFKYTPSDRRTRCVFTCVPMCVCSEIYTYAHVDASIYVYTYIQM